MFGFNGRLWLLGFWGLNAKVGGLGLVVWALFLNLELCYEVRLVKDPTPQAQRRIAHMSETGAEA